MDYPSASTPAVVEGRIYFVGSAAVAYCLDAKDGRTIWETKTLGAKHDHNRSSSPLLLDGRMIFSTDSRILALDAKSGEIVWSNAQAVGKEASPAIWRLGDKTNILCLAVAVLEGYDYYHSKFLCLDPADGRVVWSAPVSGSASTPVISGDLAVFCTADKTNGLAAYRISAERAKLLWSVPLMDWSTSVVVLGKHVYAIGGANTSDGFGEGKGRAVCVDSETGQVVWNEVLGKGAELASPVLADGKIIAEVGPWLYLIQADPAKYTLLGKANLDLAKWTSPALADGKVFLRSRQSVVCYDLEARKANAP